THPLPTTLTRLPPHSRTTIILPPSIIHDQSTHTRHWSHQSRRMHHTPPLRLFTYRSITRLPRKLTSRSPSRTDSIGLMDWNNPDRPDQQPDTCQHPPRILPHLLHGSQDSSRKISQQNRHSKRYLFIPFHVKPDKPR